MKINFTETFPHLSRAPIVEAVIDLRAKPSVQWNQEDFQERLKHGLSDYPIAQPQRLSEVTLEAKAGMPIEQRVVDRGWSGLLFRSKDQLQVAQFQKEGFAFSRLKPYQQWELFEAEALRLWKIYVELVTPLAIQRIGVRFINRMVFPAAGFKLDDYIIGSSQPLASIGLIRDGLLHRDTLIVPETSYHVNLIRTVQPLEGTPPNVPVILDIDVFTATPMEPDDSSIRQRLSEMRCLKNKVFFGIITRKAKGHLQ